ncbi:MAG: nicotinate (nicotinamide) nucleotide adenylyltransferase [Candidatus Eremiobacteraeota bacterium]|nr:nicotinate (nicotinamide) nucleotide adenylyltransferase [Candidatus Eremiobacteraeota bacterium]MBV8366176.1 nicotinate (nicotinamide) nucleotide adenylyltransferase [Candidatus Eremiobacteraeota bacterium]
MSAQRIGVLGGTFDPIHYGHLFIAEAVRGLAKLDRVLFLPVGDPAHREVHASAHDRLEMVRRALAGNPAFAIDTTALEQRGPVYTADTLALMRQKLPDDALSFIAGVDSLTVSRWRRLDEVAAALERFYVVRREGARSEDVAAIVADLPEDLRKRFVVLDLPLVDISASVIRARAKAGASIRYLTPDDVARLIEDRGLYRGA